ncbi:unnamed protein product [Phytophthora lilii]|uniref:Unnamed protein product n=1 Tax=Phytophthora lilii TaxID=2077276 RepID=A0A9W6YIQ1_9STRA|nr:unnamed protein product [Phytophthora lilii]
MEAAVWHFENWKNFSTWDRETLACWIKGAVVYDEKEQAAVLACNPLIEASVYAGSRLCLTEDELAAPRCPITFHSGDRTKLFDRSVFDALASQHPSLYTTHRPLPNTSHLMVLEDPVATSAAILADLSSFPALQSSIAYL